MYFKINYSKLYYVLCIAVILYDVVHCREAFFFANFLFLIYLFFQRGTIFNGHVQYENYLRAFVPQSEVA